jgi:hypothetical protein
VEITYCAATKPICECEDVAAILVPGESPNHQINADHGHDLMAEPEALELVVVERLNGKTPRVTLLEPETYRCQGFLFLFLVLVIYS